MILYWPYDISFWLYIFWIKIFDLLIRNKNDFVFKYVNSWQIEIKNGFCFKFKYANSWQIKTKKDFICGGTRKIWQ